MTMMFPVGIAITLLFALVSVSVSSWLRPASGLKTVGIFISFAAVINPFLAIGAGVGLGFFCGLKYCSIINSIAFIILGIGKQWRSQGGEFDSRYCPSSFYWNGAKMTSS